METTKKEKVRIQDDLYNHVNGEWLEKAVIPNDRPTAGGFADLREDVNKLLKEDLIKMSKEKKYPNAHLENAVKLMDLARDTKRREEDGIGPVLPVLNRIDAIADIADFNEKLPELLKDGVPMPFTLGIAEDMKDASRYCVSLAGPKTILPDSNYYKEEMKAQKKQMLKAWKPMAASVIALTGLSKAKQTKYIKDTMAFDELVATYVKSMEEWADYVKCYNPMPLSKVATLVKPMDIQGMLAGIFTEDQLKEAETVIIEEPRYFKGFKKVFNKDTFELYKHWAYVKTLLDATDYLSEELRDLGSTFQRAITGVAEIPVVDKYAFEIVSHFFNEPIGLYYGEKYFGEVAKKDVTDMVKDVIEAYKKRVAKNDFLSEATKEKAILKLNTMGLKLAYPDKIDPIFDKFVVDADKSLYENICNINRIDTIDSYSKLGTVVDKTKWVMPAHMVNACYNPCFNDISFPAAILQAPFYSIKQSRSQNLGGIGAVIAHEISHAFDNNGAEFDENGNLNNWWTAEDHKKFKARTKAMIKQFDKIELPWGTVNGSFIVSENIADNGGVAATLEVMSGMSDADYEEYFKNWARVWCMKAKDEYRRLILSIDVHAPNVLRANMPPRNFQEWYDTFNVTKDDKMYIAPAKRVVIW